MSNATLFLTVFLTGLLLVVAGLGMAILLSPKSFNTQKGEPYECGIPTHGTSWMQFKAGYYLYAILYLMFDVEAIFLFPWATIVRELGVQGLTSIVFFLVILGLGLAYAWRKGVLQWK
ncbi:MAG: NADH-quinone oxidoreductase subunit A [Porphyromonadaceae bacterium CG2_30_38_12]|nr:MAG: NADH-quinone oxidoreductase subunit A [Porphyromonadaceae bacterium CG2_30_38_12]